MTQCNQKTTIEALTAAGVEIPEWMLQIYKAFAMDYAKVVARQEATDAKVDAMTLIMKDIKDTQDSFAKPLQQLKLMLSNKLVQIALLAVFAQSIGIPFRELATAAFGTVFGVR